eukprot:TRINITY_DN67106_c2_g1_i8.p3 TRINITY_DN67106_c2_g1~~TRINITY_DN67106_c2_g1_i8.p3  ORF type:complete len:112 (+),score=11.61 TRINITY_DN67106_c2_g1_i8:665-1000(+)
MMPDICTAPSNTILHMWKTVAARRRTVNNHSNQQLATLVKPTTKHNVDGNTETTDALTQAVVKSQANRLLESESCTAENLTPQMLNEPTNILCTADEFMGIIQFMPKDCYL